jgi:hypothetical protein
LILEIQRFSSHFESWFKIDNSNRLSNQFLNNSLKNSRLRQCCRGETFGVKVVKLINKVGLNGKMWELIVYFCSKSPIIKWIHSSGRTSVRLTAKQGCSFLRRSKSS